MDSQRRMEIVDDLFSDLSQIIGRLTNQGVFTVEEGMKVIKSISDKETEWMKNKFSDEEIYEFMKNHNI